MKKLFADADERMTEKNMSKNEDVFFVNSKDEKWNGSESVYGGDGDEQKKNWEKASQKLKKYQKSLIEKKKSVDLLRADVLMKPKDTINKHIIKKKLRTTMGKREAMVMVALLCEPAFMSGKTKKY